MSTDSKTGNSGKTLSRIGWQDPVVPPRIVDGESETIDGTCSLWGGLEILNGGSVTAAENSDLEILSHLTLSNGAHLINNGSVTAESVSVTGKGNVISGNLISVHHIPTYHILDNSYSIQMTSSILIPISSVFIAEDADLTISKDQYDAFSSISVQGTLYVQRSAGNALRQTDIDKIIRDGMICNISFQQDLINVKNLIFTASQSITVQDAFGTDKNDSIRFCKGITVTFGGTGNTIDLFEGKNSIRADANTQVSILSHILHVHTIQVAGGTRVRENRISRQVFTDFSCGDVTFSSKPAATVSIGSFSSFSSGNLTGGDLADKITAGTNSTLQTGDIRGFEKITLASGKKWKETSSSTAVQGYTRWTAGDVDSTEQMTITAGDHTVCSVGNITMGITTIDLSPTESWTFSVNQKNDSVKIGKYAEFRAESIHFGGGKNTFSSGQGSTVSVTGDIKGLWKLQLADSRQGSAGSFTSGNISGTDEADTLYFGKFNVCSVRSIDTTDGWAEHPGNDRIIIGDYAQLEAGSLTFGKGNDLLEIRSHAAVNITGLLDFSSGKNSLVIGKNAQVTLKSTSADSLVRFSIGKGTQAFLSRELASCEKLKSSGATLFDIGSAEEGVAQNFTSLALEQQDNSLKTAQTLTEASYSGWLCGANSLDPLDFFECGTAGKILCGNTSDALIVSQWDSDGQCLASTSFGDTIRLDESAVYFSVALDLDLHAEDKATAYQFTLA